MSCGEESFTEAIVHQIHNSFSRDYYEINNTELSFSEITDKIMENNNKFFKTEYDKIKNSDYLILIFPYLITGIPGIVKEYFDNILYIHEDLDSSLNKTSTDLLQNKLINNNNRSKGLIITHTDFTQESYQPNSLHQSTIKRRLHCLNWMTLKSIGIEPLEPVVLYSPAYSNMNRHLSHKSTLESFVQYNSKKSDQSNLNPSPIPNISGINANQDESNLNNNLTNLKNDYMNSVDDYSRKSRSINISRNSIEKNRAKEQKYRNEFLSEISKINCYLDLLPKIDLTDI
jgi:putative NADPH-quinone reductase